MARSAAGLKAALAELQSLDRPALVERFQMVFEADAPKRAPAQVLRLALAYRLQESTFGGLKPVIRAALLARSLDSIPATRPSMPSAGSVLIREWQGRSHTVKITASGIEYSGTPFRSLTEVAFRITGQKRSGPAFFGLRSPSRG